MKQIRISLLTALVVVLVFTACGSTKQVSYLQDSITLPIDTATTVYQARVCPHDLLTISVSSSDEDAVRPFNLVVPNSHSDFVSTHNTWSAPILQNYLVDAAGTITFPTLGKLKVSGLTTPEVAELIVRETNHYLKEAPIVTVRIVNYKISILGEVNHPGVYTINNSYVNLLEALAMAGDLTIYGKRDNIRIIRRQDDRQRIITLNLNDQNIIHHPDYYLQQNDVVYVEPHKNRQHEVGMSKRTDLILRIASILATLVAPFVYYVF
ncbi:MAG: polysaccharide biosynthesis/export family protein [Mediterranea sp.]|jgi:polysaccharide export outer membrane protein|nr:polysaccharide biosynthesis/export family protein [Mediterranea sp.]